MLCVLRCEGCEWVGQSDQVAAHVKLCKAKPKEELIKTIEEKDAVISKLRHATDRDNIHIL